MFHGGDIFKLGASAAAGEFCEWVQVGIDVYTSHRKYQAKAHSSPWFSAAFVSVRVHKNHFLCLYQKDKSSNFKVKLRQASSVLKHGKSAIPPLFNDPKVLSSASDKEKFFAENFSKNSNLDDVGISLTVFLSRTNLKLQNISVTPKMIKKVIRNLALSKASNPGCSGSKEL